MKGVRTVKEFTNTAAIEVQDLPDDLFAKDDSAYEDADRMTRPSLSYWSDAWRRFRSNRLAMISAVILLLIILMAIFQPMFSRYDYDTNDLFNTNQGPSMEHLFGTDSLGRDIFTRCWEGARVSLSIALLSRFSTAPSAFSMAASPATSAGWPTT